MRCVLRIELTMMSSASAFVYDPYVLETTPFNGIVVQIPVVNVDEAKREVQVMLHVRHAAGMVIGDWVCYGFNLPACPEGGLRYEYRGIWTCLLESEDPTHPRWGSSGEWEACDEIFAAKMLMALREPRKKPRIKPNVELDEIVDVGSLPRLKRDGKHAFYVRFANGKNGEVMPWTRFLVSETEFHPAFVQHLRVSHQSKARILRALEMYADEHAIGLRHQLGLVQLR